MYIAKDRKSGGDSLEGVRPEHNLNGIELGLDNSTAQQELKHGYVVNTVLIRNPKFVTIRTAVKTINSMPACQGWMAIFETVMMRTVKNLRGEKREPAN